MTPSAAQASYARTLKETVYIRRYAGNGTARTKVDVRARAKVVGYAPQELVGSVVQGDRRAIVYAADLVNNGLTLPLRKTDKLVAGGKEMAIIALDDETRKVGSTLIAYELQVRA